MEIKWEKLWDKDMVHVEVFLTTKDITELLDRGAVGLIQAGSFDGENPGHFLPGISLNVREA